MKVKKWIAISAISLLTTLAYADDDSTNSAMSGAAEAFRNPGAMTDSENSATGPEEAMNSPSATENLQSNLNSSADSQGSADTATGDDDY